MYKILHTVQIRSLGFNVSDLTLFHPFSPRKIILIINIKSITDYFSYQLQINYRLSFYRYLFTQIRLQLQKMNRLFKIKTGFSNLALIHIIWSRDQTSRSFEDGKGFYQSHVNSLKIFMSNLIRSCSSNLPDGILRAVSRYGDNRRYRDKLVSAS